MYTSSLNLALEEISDDLSIERMGCGAYYVFSSPMVRLRTLLQSRNNAVEALGAVGNGSLRLSYTIDDPRNSENCYWSEALIKRRVVCHDLAKTNEFLHE